MTRQPGVYRWADQLTHRPDEQHEAIVERFTAAGVTAGILHDALADGGDALHAAATSGADDWANDFGGSLAAALLAAEVSLFSAHLVSRASAVRALAVESLLDEYSAVAVAAALGVSRQKVYDIGKGPSSASFIPTVPWRQS